MARVRGSQNIKQEQCTLKNTACALKTVNMRDVSVEVFYKEIQDWAAPTIGKSIKVLEDCLVSNLASHFIGFYHYNLSKCLALLSAVKQVSEIYIQIREPSVTTMIFNSVVLIYFIICLLSFTFHINSYVV